MPVSKQRRKKGGGKGGAKAGLPAIPTRRMREAYVAATDAGAVQAALAEADAIVVRAVESGMPRLEVQAAHRALAISPLCSAAYGVLAAETRDVEVALDLSKRAVHAAELAVGPDALERMAGQSWGEPATRSYLVAMHGLVDVLLELDREEEAVVHMETMLRLNPGDDMGVRYALLGYHLDQFELSPARALLAAFPDETSTTWLYSRLLLAYRDEMQGDAETQRLVEAAVAANPYVPGMLLETEPDALIDDLADIEPGSPAEAASYAASFSEAWASTPGASPWLRARAAAAGLEFP
jgi:hypothetical protein